MAQSIPTKYIILLCVLASVFGTVLLRGTQAAPASAVSVGFQSTKSAFTLHEPVIISMEIRNNLTESISFDLGRDRKQNFLFFVTMPNGYKMQLPEIRKSGFSRSGVVNLNAAQSYKQSLLLNEWSQFDKIGRYEIEATMTGPIRYEQSNQDEGRQASRFSIEILPLNDRELKKACASLADAIESSESYEEAAEDANALSHVQDEIAIPYLRKALLATKLVEPIAIEGLERIGSYEAVEALVSGFQVKYNNTPTLIGSALLRIEDKSADPQIKALIASTLRKQLTHE